MAVARPELPHTLEVLLHEAVFDLTLACIGQEPTWLDKIAEHVGLEDQPDEVRNYLVAYSGYYADLF